MIDSFLYAKLPPHIIKSLSLAYLENRTYDQIVANLERELEVGGLKSDGELSIPTMTVAIAKENENKPDVSKHLAFVVKNWVISSKVFAKESGTNKSENGTPPKSKKLST